MTPSVEHILPEWIYVPELEASIQEAESIDDFLNNNSILLSILNHIQEGISILSPDLNVLYVNQPMRNWYNQNTISKSRKCYRLYHDSRQPCENCPTKLCLATGLPQSGIVSFRPNEEKHGQMNIHVAPIKNKAGDIVLLLEYVQNITLNNHAKASIESLEERISLLENQNQLLLRSLTLCEAKYQNLENTIAENMNKHIRPALEYMKQKVSPEDYSLVSSIIDQSIYPITDKHSSVMSTLTGREREVALLIREGHSSKQIADELFITKKAVDYHRTNIRKKLGLDAKANLKVFLEMNL